MALGSPLGIVTYTLVGTTEEEQKPCGNGAGLVGVSLESCLVKTIEGHEQRGMYHHMSVGHQCIQGNYSAGQFYKIAPSGT